MRVSRAAKGLLQLTDKWSSSIQVDNRVNIILDYLEAPYYTYSDLLRLSKYKSIRDEKIINPEYVNFGAAILKYFKSK